MTSEQKFSEPNVPVFPKNNKNNKKLDFFHTLKYQWPNTVSVAYLNYETLVFLRYLIHIFYRQLQESLVFPKDFHHFSDECYK